MQKKSCLFFDNNRYIPSDNVFYKYYALSDNSVDAVTSRYIYASHPNQLNDPYDCDKDMIVFDDEETNRKLLDVLPKKVQEDVLSPEMRPYLPLFFNTIAYKKCGIFSMTQKPTNVLMWAHYAGKNGFCVEFDINKFSFDYYGPFLIKYENELPKIFVSKMGLKCSMFKQCTTKLSHWKYEEEWRLIVENPDGQDLQYFGCLADKLKLGNEHDRRFYYPQEAVRKVILGCEFFDKCSPESNISENSFSGTKKEKRLKVKLFRYLLENNISVSCLIKDEVGGYVIVDLNIIKQ